MSLYAIHLHSVHHHNGALRPYLFYAAPRFTARPPQATKRRVLHGADPQLAESQASQETGGADAGVDPDLWISSV